MYVFDNDTSGLWSSPFSGQFRMTVQDRCGQCNELSLVCVFLESLSVNKGASERRCFLIGR